MITNICITAKRPRRYTRNKVQDSAHKISVLIAHFIDIPMFKQVIVWFCVCTGDNPLKIVNYFPIQTHKPYNNVPTISSKAFTAVTHKEGMWMEAQAEL